MDVFFSSWGEIIESVRVYTQTPVTLIVPGVMPFHQPRSHATCRHVHTCGYEDQLQSNSAALVRRRRGVEDCLQHPELPRTQQYDIH